MAIILAKQPLLPLRPKDIFLEWADQFYIILDEDNYEQYYHNNINLTKCLIGKKIC